MASLAPALPCAAQDRETFEARVDACLERARPALLHHLQHENGDRLALVMLAAVHDGVPHGAPEFERALAELADTHLGVYALALRLMVMAYLPGYPDREQAAERDTTDLLAHQGRRGGFRYQHHPNDFDFSVTQYAVLGLRAAEFLGVDVKTERWKQIAACAVRDQRPDGGFAYTGSGAATPSMTAAGIAILELCRQRLADSGAQVARLDRELESAWRWLDGNAASIGKDGGGHNLYFHYGLERACILSDRDEVGGRDWYRAGAEMLFELQTRSGGFFGSRADRRQVTRASRYGDSVDTAFAILFLHRSFQRQITPRSAGPTTPASTPFCHALPEDADPAAERLAAAADVRRGLPAMPDLLQALRSDVAPRRRAALRAVIRLTGQDFGYHPARDADANRDGLRAAERWWLQHRESAGGPARQGPGGGR